MAVAIINLMRLPGQGSLALPQHRNITGEQTA